MMKTPEFVTDLRIYPIKSLGSAMVEGNFPTELTIGKTGLIYDEPGYESVLDREFVIVDSADLFVSQRGWNESKAVKNPGDKLLAVLDVEINSDHLLVGDYDAGYFEIPTAYPKDIEPQTIDIFGKPFYGFEIFGDAPGYLSAYLGREVRVLRTDRNHLREPSLQYHREGAVNKMAAADGQSITWARYESLEILHRRAGIPQGQKSIFDFRSNIISDGSLEAVEDLVDEKGGYLPEDYVAFVAIGALEAYVTKGCERCPIPDIEQLTGEHDGLSTKLLTGTRRGRLSDEPEGTKNRPFYTENLNHLRSSVGKKIRVNDEVYVVVWNTSPNIILKNVA